MPRKKPASARKPAKKPAAAAGKPRKRVGHVSGKPAAAVGPQNPAARRGRERSVERTPGRRSTSSSRKLVNREHGGLTKGRSPSAGAWETGRTSSTSSGNMVCSFWSFWAACAHASATDVGSVRPAPTRDDYVASFSKF